MNHGRRRIKRRAHISYGFEFFIFDEDGFRSVLGCGSARRDHSRDGFTLSARAIDRDCVLRRGFQAFQVREHTNPWRDDG